jgi:hypothetical protein
MNPLPNRLPLTLTVPPVTGISPSATTNDPQTSALAPGTILEVPERPRKVLSDGPFPPTQPGVIGLGVKGVGDLEAEVPGLSNLVQEVAEEEKDAKPDRPSLNIKPNEVKDGEEQNKILTAIYKPESKEAWKQALRQANEQAEKTSARPSDSLASDAGKFSGILVIPADQSQAIRMPCRFRRRIRMLPPFTRMMYLSKKDGSRRASLRGESTPI